MMQPGNVNRLSPKRIAVIGNHLPRQCGIATFTTDLLEALINEVNDVECCAGDRQWGQPLKYKYQGLLKFIR